MSGSLLQQIFLKFKSRGLAINADAGRALERLLTSDSVSAYQPQEALDIVLAEIKLRIEKREIQSNVISRDMLTSIVEEVSMTDADLESEAVELIDAARLPRIRYNDHTKTYQIETQPVLHKFPTFGGANSHNNATSGSAGSASVYPNSSSAGGAPSSSIASPRGHMYRSRVQLVVQRLLRSGNFRMKGMLQGGRAGSGGPGAAITPATHEISSVESLLGDVRRQTRVLVGLITQPSEGEWCLEDLTGSVRLDLAAYFAKDQTSGGPNRAATKPAGNVPEIHGFIAEGCVVVVQGFVDADRFKVEAIGHPPGESREDSMLALGATVAPSEAAEDGVAGQCPALLDTLGCGIRPAQWPQLLRLEEQAEGSFFVIISDVQLDKPRVMDSLRTILEGFSDAGGEPIFILMGPFVSSSGSGVRYMHYSNNSTLASGGSGNKSSSSKNGNYFDELADLIVSYPTLAQTAKFILVPGYQDPGAGSVYPLSPLSSVFTKSLSNKVKHVLYASNPCRLRFYTQEIVIFREDVLRKMRRYALLQPRSSLLSLPSSSATANYSDPIDIEDTGEDDAVEETGDDNYYYNPTAPSASSSYSTEDGAMEVEEGEAGRGELRADKDLNDHLVETIVKQGHLCPLPPAVRPIYWEYDHTMRLFPLPDVLILADRTEQFSINCLGCSAVNPGSFAADASFVVYRPATRSVEFSRV